MAMLRIDNGDGCEPCRVAYKSTPKRSVFTALHCKRTSFLLYSFYDLPAEGLPFVRHVLDRLIGLKYWSRGESVRFRVRVKVMPGLS